ncbi:MAG: DUF6089 family protein [Ferruginibacter sp.]
MKKLTVLVALTALLTGFSQKASAQYYFYDGYSYDTPLMFELGGSFGFMNCLTDLGGKRGLGKKGTKDLNMGNTKTCGSVYLSATWRDAIALRLEATFGRVEAYDSILKSVAPSTNGRYERNLNFRSKITEVSLVAEFHPLFIFINWPSTDVDPPKISPYIAAGIGLFSFNPQAKNRNGQYVDLQPLSLEGQGFAEYPDRKPYKLTQFSFPVGLGVRYELSPSFNLRLEFLHRITSTDYLDDVSTRYIDPQYFATNGLTGTQLRDALDLASNDRVNPGGPTGKFRKTEGGIRGDPTDKDGFFTFNLKIGLAIGRERIR